MVKYFFHIFAGRFETEKEACLYVEHDYSQDEDDPSCPLEENLGGSWFDQVFVGPERRCVNLSSNACRMALFLDRSSTAKVMLWKALAKAFDSKARPKPWAILAGSLRKTCVETRTGHGSGLGTFQTDPFPGGAFKSTGFEKSERCLGDVF